MKRLRFSKLAALLPQPKPRKTKTSLRVTASRLVPTSFDEDEEPTTKLSTAFVVVLALHVVAVGGIYAFHSIKSHRREADGTALKVTGAEKKEKVAVSAAAPGAEAAPKAAVADKSSSVPAAPSVTAPVRAAAATAPNFAPTPAPVQVKAPAGVPAGSVSEKNTGPSAVLPQPRPATPAAAAAGSPPSGKTAPPAPAAADSAVVRTYTVKRGDNPWSIAKSQGVSYEELMKLNGLDNPKKLQLGQVLKLPPKKTGN
jgi:LysM repeat protein